MEKEKVLLGMSGGVDSSVSAILLKQMGYEVIGATMKLWEGNNEDSSLEDVKKICEKLGILHYTFDFKDEFKKCVIDDFACCYQNGKTPNPCIECNEKLKFKAFYQKAVELGCKYISTGHYAKQEYLEKYNGAVIRKSNNDKKDQTYFLYRMPEEVVDKIIFPLADFKDKEEIRQIAKEHGLSVASKSDSQEICFIPDNDYTKFLIDTTNQKPKEGNIVTAKGEILGRHKGLIYYTVGQRKGLGIAYKEPLYVIRIDEKNNEIVVGSEKELYTNVVYAEDLRFLLSVDLSKKVEVMAKVRYRAKAAKAILTVEKGKAKLEFEEPQRAVTPGQSVVFYMDDVLLGGGKII